MKAQHLFTLGGIAAALLGLHQQALADDATELSPVVITATRTPVTVDASLAAVTVISQDQIANGPARDLPELLRYYGGIDVIRAGGPGQQTSIFMRGANSNQTLVLVDGVRVNEGISGLANVQYLNTANIDHIEIVKGPRSTLYGADAIGGVINIITRRPGDTATLLTLSAAGEHTFAGQLQQDFSAGAFGGSAHVGSSNTNGYAVFPNSDFDSGNKSRNVGLDLDYKKDDLSLRGRFEENTGTNQYDDGYATTPYHQAFTNVLGTLEAGLQVSPGYKTSLRVSSYRDGLNQLDYVTPYGKPPELDYAHTRRTDVDWQNDYSLPDNNLVSIGAGYSDTELLGLSYASAVNTSLSSSNAYIQDQWQHEAFSAQLGGRYENHKQYGEHVTGELALGYALGAHDRVYASHSLGFRAPDGAEILGPGGNLKLNPEQATSREIGYHHDNGGWSLQTDVFRNDIKGLIQCPFGGSCMNVKKATLSGAEIGTTLTAGQWVWQSKAAYTKAIDADSRQDLLRRPRRSLSSGLDYQLERYSVGGEVVSQSTSKDFGSVILPGFAVLNLHTSVKLCKGAKLRVGIDNVTGKHYGLASNGLMTDGNTQYYTAQPRLLSAAVDMKF
jgi:vitamin B12 transporter